MNIASDLNDRRNSARLAPEAGDPLRDNGYVTAISHFYRDQWRI